MKATLLAVSGLAAALAAAPAVAQTVVVNPQMEQSIGQSPLITGRSTVIQPGYAPSDTLGDPNNLLDTSPSFAHPEGSDDVAR